MSVPCAASACNYVSPPPYFIPSAQVVVFPSTPDPQTPADSAPIDGGEHHLFQRLRAVFTMEPEGTPARSFPPLTCTELIRRKVIELLGSEQRSNLVIEHQQLARFRSQSNFFRRENQNRVLLAAPATPVLDLLNHQVCMCERHLVLEVLDNLSYQAKITLLYHYNNESLLLEAVRFRRRMFKRIDELCA